MRQFVYATGIFICLCSISSKDKNSGSFEPKLVTPVVLDTFKVHRRVYYKRWLNFATYTPLYIGKNRDTLYVNHLELSQMKDENDFDEKKFSFDERYIKYNLPSPSKLSLFVDTNRIISNLLTYMDTTINTIPKLQTTILIADKCYPVIIENKSMDTLIIGHAYTLHIILEAMDKNSKWKPIETFNWSWGDKNKGIFIPPSNIAITSVQINKGEFETKLRLRLKNILSNEFNGSIYLTQFESEYDDGGIRKPLPKD